MSRLDCRQPLTLQDHINELRAELRGCLNRRERAKITAEIEAAIATLEGAAEAKRPPG